MNYTDFYFLEVKELKDKIAGKWIHSKWPHVVEIARPSTSLQHALHLISAVRYYFHMSKGWHTCKTNPSMDAT
jgi:hypothetical protein